ncbi:MAG: hypothetical protein CM1200mP16_09860 [Nitrospina sp.]|nr:MAG: hypothetical protein CM1200mP16_09860 [Nitrospina sp.]
MGSDKIALPLLPLRNYCISVYGFASVRGQGQICSGLGKIHVGAKKHLPFSPAKPQ